MGEKRAMMLNLDIVFFNLVIISLKVRNYHFKRYIYNEQLNKRRFILLH